MLTLTCTSSRIATLLLSYSLDAFSKALLRRPASFPHCEPFCDSPGSPASGLQFQSLASDPGGCSPGRNPLRQYFPQPQVALAPVFSSSSLSLPVYATCLASTTAFHVDDQVLVRRPLSSSKASLQSPGFRLHVCLSCPPEVVCPVSWAAPSQQPSELSPH
jgi:hypothetical protein